MNINRHNYETFFLMYADNELCAADRKAVEVFVAENADLKTELELILQTVFTAEDIVFENKAALQKEEMTPLQEQLLLYADNELNADEKEKTQQLIHTDTVAAKEWSQLQKTILQPDTTIVFANRQSLYRKEEGRVVRTGWWRAAAAAVLLGFGTWTAITLLKPAPQTVESTVATATKPKPAAPVNGNTNTITAAPQPQTPVIAENTVAGTNPVTAPAVKAAAQKKSTPAANTVKQQLPQDKNDNNAVAKEDKKPGNNLPKPLYNNFNSNNRNETITAYVPPKEDATSNLQSGNANVLVASSVKPNTGAVNGYALNTSFNPDEAGEANDNKVLYMDEENVKRSKLAGFIRKVKRVVERNTNLKTGNGIKVAGFDIALNK